MRKFIPRILNFISFTLALMLLLPTRYTYLYDLLNIENFMYKAEGFRVYLYPAIIVLCSFIGLVSPIKKNKSKVKNSIPLRNLFVKPLLYFIIFSSISGILFCFAYPTYCAISSFEFYFLGVLVNGIRFMPMSWFIIYFLLLIFGIISLSLFKNIGNRKFGRKLLLFVILLLLCLISSRGVSAWYTLIKSPAEFVYNDCCTLRALMNTGLLSYLLGSVFIADGAFLLLYIVCGSIACHKNNKIMLKYAAEGQIIDSEVIEEQPIEEQVNENAIVEEVVEEPVVEEVKEEIVLEEQQEEVKEQIEEVSESPYSFNDLKFIFQSEHDFKDVNMIATKQNKSYYRNGIEFIIMASDRKTVYFRLQSRKAVRLIIKYPGIRKEETKDSITWVSIINLTTFSKLGLLELLNSAYESVL